MPLKIALVEDDDVIRDNYAEQLRDNGYVVECHPSRPAAESAFSQSLPDLALLDIGLNDEREGGFELCKNIRKISESIPIIFLTSYDQDIDEISGLRIGADDYISKEESFAKILVRISSLLRRVNVASTAGSHTESGSSDQHQVRVGNLVIDMVGYSVEWKNKKIRLPLTQLWILYALASRPDTIKSKEALMEAANITHSSSNTIPVHINAIRRKFKDIDKNFCSISNERGMGYRWITQSPIPAATQAAEP